MPPGFGHRFHTRDPRAGRLFQMALELELEGEHVSGAGAHFPELKFGRVLRASGKRWFA